MTPRGAAVIGAMLALFVACVGVLGARQLTVGPERATADDTAIAARAERVTVAEQRVRAAAATHPPALPRVPDRLPEPTSRSVAPVLAQYSAPVAGGGRSAERDDEMYEGEHEYEDEHAEEHGDDDAGEWEEGDDDDD